MNKLQHNETSYKYFTLMAVLYVTLLLMTMVVENRVIVLDNLNILSGTIVLALSYSLSDIITEVYGYTQMRRVIWISIVSLYVSSLLIFIIMALPADPVNATSKSFDVIFSSFSEDILTYSIAALVGTFLNAFILSKWKVLTRGRYFWLRSLGAMAIGEAIFILIWGFLGFSTKFPLEVLLKLMAASYIYKVICNLVTIIPTALAVTFLKKSENVDVLDPKTNFNPFAWET